MYGRKIIVCPYCKCEEARRYAGVRLYFDKKAARKEAPCMALVRAVAGTTRLHVEERARLRRVLREAAKRGAKA